MRMQDARRRPLPPPSEDEMRWRRFLAELPDRIAAIRAEAPTTCETCGSTTPEVVEDRTCNQCARTLPIARFSRNRTNPGGREYWCKQCKRAYDAARATQTKIRSVLGRTA